MQQNQIVKTWDISGMGKGYENACQKMLWTGIKYLSKIDNPSDIFTGMISPSFIAKEDIVIFNSIKVKKNEKVELIGILNTPESCRELEDAMLKSIGGDCSGAMHQYVMNHLRFIAKNGIQGWHDELRKCRDGEQELNFNLEKMSLVVEN